MSAGEYGDSITEPGTSDGDASFSAASRSWDRAGVKRKRTVVFMLKGRLRPNADVGSGELSGGNGVISCSVSVGCATFLHKRCGSGASRAPATGVSDHRDLLAVFQKDHRLGFVYRALGEIRLNESSITRF